MVTFQRESWRECRVNDDVESLLQLHYNELTAYKDIVKLDPDHARYDLLEDSGALECYTARDSGVMVGYSLWFVQYTPHYRTLLNAQNDVLFLLPQYRKGTVGVRFIKYSIEQIEERGADKICFHVKVINDWSAILKRLGFAHEESLWSKPVRRKAWA